MPRSSAIPATNDVPSFDVVEAVTPVGTAPCSECRGPIVDTYYEADQRVICAACQTRIASANANQHGEPRFLKALVFGIIAALGGAGAYFALLAVTGREMTLVLLVVGFIVGRAVRLGSGRRGGRRFQWLAVGLTYLAVVTTYVPFVMKGYSGRSSAVATETVAVPIPDASLFTVASPPPSPAPDPSLGATAFGFGALLLLAVVAPLLEGANNLLALVITLAALVQAWRMNRSTTVAISGPYRAGSG